MSYVSSSDSTMKHPHRPLPEQEMMSPCLELPQHRLFLSKGQMVGYIHLGCLGDIPYRARHILGAQETPDK